MSSEDDYSLLDQPEIVQFVFHPRRDYAPGPTNSSDHLIHVDEDTDISCRFYVHKNDSPCILYFHGNGEVVSDHNYVAPEYDGIGVNLFVADYRGYGRSGGMPGFRSMVDDAHVIYKAFFDIKEETGHSGNLFVMGRSLGSISAVELAYHQPEDIRGLILESALASISGLISRMGYNPIGEDTSFSDFPNLAKIRDITLPTLILHGEDDILIPFTHAKAMFDASPAQDKRLEIIPYAGHNDIILQGRDQYFSAIEAFVH